MKSQILKKLPLTSFSVPSIHLAEQPNKMISAAPNHLADKLATRAGLCQQSGTLPKTRSTDAHQRPDTSVCRGPKQPFVFAILNQTSDGSGQLT